jgi:hypothetical protein
MAPSVWLLRVGRGADGESSGATAPRRVARSIAALDG